MSFWKDKKITVEKKNELLKETCRKVFSTPDGKIVLNMLMTDLFLYERTLNDRQNILNDYAKFFIQERLGVSSKKITDFIAETAATEGGIKC